MMSSNIFPRKVGSVPSGLTPWLGSWSHLRLTGLVIFGFLGMSFGLFAPLSFGQTSPRPVVFVHGIMGDSEGWGLPTDPQNLRGALITRLAAASMGYTNTSNYDVYYNGIAVLYSVTGKPEDDLLAVESIPSDARFFTIRFYSRDSADPFEPGHTAQVSVLNKAAELEHVLDAISQITHVQDSILVAHSQGGLVARAYLEALGSENPCDDISYLGPCSPGQVTYAGNIAHVVTLDTPFGGGDFSEFLTYFVVFKSKLLGGTPINVFELMPNSVVLRAINYQSASVNGVFPQPLPSTTTIDSVVSYLSDLGYPCPDNGTLTCFSDDIVESRSQGIRENIDPSQRSPELADVGNPISANDPQIVEIRGVIIGQGACPLALPGSPFPPASNNTPQGVLLHLISCEGHVTPTQNAVYQSVFAHAQGVTTTVTVQATLNRALFTQPFNYTLINQGALGTTSQPGLPAPHIFVDLPLGIYSVGNIKGGPSSTFTISTTGFAQGVEVATNRLGFDPASGKRVTDLFISIDFVTNASTPPTVATSPASGQKCDSVVLNGTANPNGTGANTYFEWGTSSQLSSFSSTIPQTIQSSNVQTPFSFTLTGLACNTNYSYRAVADNGGGPVRGSIVSFTTLATLPKPVLSTPSSGSFGVSGSPTFTWSLVNGATSYRLIVATSPGALPLDPTSAACGSGCVFNVTPTSTSYTPAAGALIAGTTYYWEVHARSPDQFGDWSTISSFTVGAPIANDFSLQLSPASQTVSVSGSVAYSVSTAITTGSPQTVTLSAANLPPGVSATFTPNILVSGNTAVLGITTSSATPAGSYTLTILASGSSSTHSATTTLVVNANSGTPALTFSPTSLVFLDQTQFTTGASQLVNFVNTGTAPLQVLSIVGDNNFVVLNPCINTLPPGTRCTFSVAFDPSTTGPIDGKTQLFFVGPTSPAVLPLHGKGLAPPPTTGTIQVTGTLNGTPLPNTQQFSYPFSYTLTGSSTLSGGGAATFTVDPGTYTISFSGSPSTLTLASVTQAATQTVSAGAVTTFTLNFTAPNDFLGPFFAFPPGGITPQIIPSGATATYFVDLPNPPPGNASTPITLDVSGVPPGATPVFDPQPLNSGLGGTLTLTTSSATTPPGAYTLSLKGTNSIGLVHPGDSSSLIVTSPPSQTAKLASVGAGGVQGNAGSSTGAAGGISADGRFVVFASQASNLTANDTNGSSDIFLRDLQANTTTLVSIAADGGAANLDSFVPSISANGRFAVFQSQADNLVAGSGATRGNNSVYLRDLQLGLTERVDIAGNGTPSNGLAFNAAVSADGRFVVFQSTATNLASGATSGLSQVYVRDRKSGQTTLVSVGGDGLPTNQNAGSPAISADGRFIAFASAATNLVPQDLGGRAQVFGRDLQAGQNILVSVANDGSASNRGVNTQATPMAISADGRFVVFMSLSTNLVSQATDGSINHVFLRDLQTQQTSLVDSDANNVPLGGQAGSQNPSISADGHFVAYNVFNQIMIRDATNNQSQALSLANDGTPGSGASFFPVISPGGAVVTFSSLATNLIPSDTNNSADTFVVQNPLLGTPFVNSITLNSPSVSGGISFTGTITLSGPSPASGAGVTLASNNSAAQVPALIFIPPGATSGTFTFNTGVVAKETVLTILASYNGGATAAVLAVQPAPSLDVAPNSWDFGRQILGITSPANSFTISNAGTAPLSINSIGLTSGQVFSISANTCGLTIPAGNTCSVSVTFTPTAALPATDSLQISFGNPVSTRSVELLGTGAVPAIVLSPGTIDFGSQNLATNSQKTVTATNIGNAVLAAIQASIAGANSPDFSIAGNSCSGTSLPPNSSCLITVAFLPSASGLRTANLVLADNAAGSPQIVVLTGTGASPTINLSTTSLAFGNQDVNTSSPLQPVTLQNTGSASLPITSISVTGPNASDFAQSNTCGLSLAAGASCTISVTFTPTAAGTRTAIVSLADSVGSQNVTLSGTGTAPNIGLSTTVVGFANQRVGSSSPLQTVTAQNTGSAALAISSITITGANVGDFSQTNNCGTRLAAGASCIVNLIFSPASSGGKTATLVLTDSVGTQSVALTGTGTAALGTLTPTSLTFPNQPLGKTSTAQTISLSNGGNAALTVTSISVTGTNSSDFAQTNSCGTGVAAGASCAINVIFTPSGAGNRTASISVVDSAGTQTATLNGIGTAPAVSLSSTNLVFAGQAVGTSSPAQTVTVTNSGNGALSITAIVVSGVHGGDFAQTNTCGGGIAAGASCTISVSFIPTAAGARSGAVTISDNAGTQSVSLAGTGVTAGPVVQLAPTTVSFRNQLVGVSTPARTINVTNTGSVALATTSIALTGTNRANFAQTNTCGTSIAVGASCTINVTFTPSAVGPRTAAVTLKDGAGTQTVTLDGIGLAALDFSPKTISFGNQALGSRGTTHVVTVTNNTGVPVSFSSIAVTGANPADFIQSATTCGSTVAWKSACAVTVVFAPVTTGTRTAALTITDDASNSPQSVALSGSGILPVRMTASLSFASQTVGTTSASKLVTIKNNLSTTLMISSITFGGINSGDFRQSATTCGPTLAVGARCTVGIVFAPSATGSRSAVLDITDNAITSPQNAVLTGTGK